MAVYVFTNGLAKHFIIMIYKALLIIFLSAVLLPACNANHKADSSDNNQLALAKSLSPQSEFLSKPHLSHVSLKPTENAKGVSTRSSNSAATNYLMGKFDPKKAKLFVKIPQKYADRKGLYLRQEALSAFIRMSNDAKRDGIRLTIRSATRNFYHQKRIWERKWLGKRKLSDGTNVARDIVKPVDKSLKVLQYSSMPGTSRHHWGTDIDLNSFNNHWFETGKGLRLFNWLEANAAKYGFCRPYTANRPYGYLEEKWHWSYMPLAKPMIREAQRYLRDDLITGFKGSSTAQQIGVVKHYILGVSKQCK